MRKILVTYIGSVARRILAGAEYASVIGVSSRGVFLHIAAGWMLFLSFERYRGPLTLNLEAGQRDLSLLEKGARVEIYPGRLVFPALGLDVDCRGAKDWQPPDLPGRLITPDQRCNRLEGVLLELDRMQKTSPLAGILGAMLSPDRQVSERQKKTFAQLAAVRQACFNRDVAMIAASIGPLLGMGAGLTPSGDDLAIGFLLALNRWGHELAPGLDFMLLNQVIVRGAYERTTLLSANLIDCASQGQADERLIIGLDGLLSEASDPGVGAASLAGWGSSSGVDALVGMGLVILAGAENSALPVEPV